MSARIYRLVVRDHTARRQNGQRYRYPTVRVGARVLRRMGWQVGDEVELRYSARRGVIELRHAALSRALKSEARRRRALERKARQALAEWRRVP
jgi:hypothetical protein